MLTFKRHFRDGFRLIKNNLGSSIWLEIMSFIMALSTMILLLLSANTNKIANNIESKARVQVYLKSDITKKQKLALKQSILDTPNVDNVTYSSAKEQLDSLVKNNKDFKVDTSDGNPVLAVYFVKLHKLNKLSETASSFKGLTGVDHVTSGASIVNSTRNALDNLKKIVWAIELAVLLLTILVSLIVNKMSVKSQKELITVQTLVGATKSYIKAPFIWQNEILAVIATILACIVSYFIYNPIYLSYNGQVNGILNMYSMTIVPIAGIGSIFIMSVITYLISLLSVKIKVSIQ